MRCVFLLGWLTTCIASLNGCVSPGAESSADLITRPNIVLIVADDQGWGDLSLTGNPVISTPYLDSLARQGAFFQQFFVSAVCSPTRAELLTGRYAVRGGVYSTSEGGERLDLDEETVADLLQQAGYRTGIFGKWHNGMQPPYHPNARGFEEFVGYCSGHWGSYIDAELEHNGDIISTEGYLTDVLTERAMSFISAHADEPFFVYLPFNTPHSPMQVPDPWWERFDTMALPMHRFRDREKIQHTRAAYAMAENLDWNVGRLAQHLAQLRLDSQTLLIYLSDNGPNGWRWNDGLAGIKGHVDEGGLRSPLIMHWPGAIAPHTEVATLSSSLDLLPTLLEAAHVHTLPQKNLDGRSLMPLLQGDTSSWPDRLLISHWAGKTSVRSQRFRLDHQGQLFDMDQDLGQTVNVADSFEQTHQALLSAAHTWEADVLTELPSEDERSFPVGHPEFVHTQLPARDAVAHGTLLRSNRWPNCSFYTNWTSTADSLTWAVEMLTEGEYEAIVYYTCRPQDTNAVLALRWQDQQIQRRLETSHDPPLQGRSDDRVPREESYVKDFFPLSLGHIHLTKGTGVLTLKALSLGGERGPDIRRVILWRRSS